MLPSQSEVWPLMTVQPKGSGEVIFSIGTSIASELWLYFRPWNTSSSRGYHVLVRGGQGCGSHLHRLTGQTASMPLEQASTAGSALYVGHVLVHQGNFSRHPHPIIFRLFLKPSDLRRSAHLQEGLNFFVQYMLFRFQGVPGRLFRQRFNLKMCTSHIYL